MNKLLILVCLFLPWKINAQKLSITTLGPSTQAIDQLQLFYQDPAIKKYSSPPTRYAVNKDGDTVRVSMYIDRATNRILVLNSNGSYSPLYSGDVNVTWFGAIGDSITDNSAAFQKAIDYCFSANKDVSYNLFIPQGKYKISTTISKVLTADSLRKSGIFIKGEGRQSTILYSDINSGALFDFSGTGAGFIDGITFQDFSILPYGTKLGDGISLKRTWDNEFNRVNIKNLKGTGIKLGEAVGVGGNPDLVAVASTKMESCDISSNNKGIESLSNNVSPMLTLFNTQVSFNVLFGIKYNSSYLRLTNCGVSRNGLAGGINAEGGIICKQIDGSAYNPKGIVIDGVELDTNYPINVSLEGCQMPSLKNCSMVMVGSILSSYGVDSFPQRMIKIGGDTVTGKTYGALIDGNRFSIVNTGTGSLPYKAVNFSFVSITGYGLNTKYQRNFFDYGTAGSLIGTKLFNLSEDIKVGFTDQAYYCDYDFPLNFSAASTTLASAYNVPFKKIFKSSQANSRNDIGIVLPTDRYFELDASVYNASFGTGRNYGIANMLVNGNSGGLFFFRAAGGPVCNEITWISNVFRCYFGTAATDTAALAALIVGKINVFSTTDGKIVIANKTGSTLNLQLLFLNQTGDFNQNNALIQTTP